MLPALDLVKWLLSQSSRFDGCMLMPKARASARQHQRVTVMPLCMKLNQFGPSMYVGQSMRLL